MKLTGVLWASVCALWVFILLCFLRLFNVLRSEYGIFMKWVSTIGLILLGIFLGMLISEKKTQIRPMIIPFILFTTGIFAAPFVAVGMLLLASYFPFSKGIEPLIFGGSITGYLLLYMLFWFWLKKETWLKSEK